MRQPSRDSVGEAIDGFDGLQAAVRDGLATDDGSDHIETATADDRGSTR